MNTHETILLGWYFGSGFLAAFVVAGVIAYSFIRTVHWLTGPSKAEKEQLYAAFGKALGDELQRMEQTVEIIELSEKDFQEDKLN